MVGKEEDEEKNHLSLFKNNTSVAVYHTFYDCIPANSEEYVVERKIMQLTRFNV